MVCLPQCTLYLEFHCILFETSEGSHTSGCKEKGTPPQALYHTDAEDNAQSMQCNVATPARCLVESVPGGRRERAKALRWEQAGEAGMEVRGIRV